MSAKLSNDTNRPAAPSFVDLLLIAINPLLIMLLVGSLLFFLLDVFYRGDFSERLQFTFAMFVVATVGIARISIAEGRSYASYFALPLAVLTVIAVQQFTNLGWLLNIALLALAWWCVDRLTWDCTVIDDEQDATGAGLLQTLGWERQLELRPVNAASSTDDAAVSAPNSFRQRWFPRRGERHTPGVWVVYFSLAAIPLFGVGQWFLPRVEFSRQRWSLLWLMVYLASALSLLLTTSLLGLRRYLRQRGAEMPTSLVASWLVCGVTLIVALLMVALVLPHPSRELALPAAVAISSPTRDASQLASGKEAATGKQDGAKVGTNAAKSNAPQSDKATEPSAPNTSSSPPNSDAQTNETSQGTAGRAEKSQSKSPSKSQASRDAASSKDKSKEDSAHDGQTSADAAPQKKQSEASPAPTSETAAEPAIARTLNSIYRGVAWLLRLASYLLLFGIVAFIAIKYRQEILATLVQLRDAWQELLARMLGRQEKPQNKVADVASLPVSAKAAPRALASFTNPFLTDMAQRCSVAELVVYSFSALEAFGRENGCSRTDGQTPIEFAATLAVHYEQLGRDAHELALCYSHVAYGGGSAPNSYLPKLKTLWQQIKPTG